MSHVRVVLEAHAITAAGAGSVSKVDVGGCGSDQNALSGIA